MSAALFDSTTSRFHSEAVFLTPSCSLLNTADMIQKSVNLWWKSAFERFRRFVYDDILHANETPRELSLGIAVGIFVAFTPTIGIQMIVAGFLAWLLGANRLVSIAMVWISNPATMLPIFWYCYRVGCAFLVMEPIGKQWWAELAKPPDGWWTSVQFFWSRILAIATPLWLGGTIVGLVFAYVSYYLSLAAISYYRRIRGLH